MEKQLYNVVRSTITGQRKRIIARRVSYDQAVDVMQREEDKIHTSESADCEFRGMSAKETVTIEECE